MNDAESRVRLTLQAWLSPAFPVGSFAYSQGLECAFVAGELPDGEALRDWLGTLLEHGPIRNDAILLGIAWQAARHGNPSLLRETNDLALALATGQERRLETSAQGRAFARTLASSWPSASFDAHMAALGSRPPAYPVAVAAAAAAHALPLAPTLDAFVFATLANAVAAATRLGTIGQTDAQKMLAELASRVPPLAQAAAHASLDDLGSATVRAEIYTYLHETQYSRLFRT
ncbi:MAG TPA: urease accessory UreF family protein [Steroidobacteraceae bacterium]|nr:urease accessory UreF family protein [Steroidobacteraceae bacterium]